MDKDGEAVSTKNVAIEVRALYKSFSGAHGLSHALSDVTFSVGRSEIVSLVGPSGCGKSTVLNVLAGFEQPSSGRVAVAGVEVTKPGPDRGMVFQTPTLFPWFSVWENIIYGPKRQGKSPIAYIDDARNLIRTVGLTGFERHYTYQLSGGMAQRVAIARALICRPNVLLLDEPFGALDAQTRLVMQRLLLDVWSEYKTTILFVTHDVEEAVFLSDRVLVMGKGPGRIVAEIPVDLGRPRDIEIIMTPAFAGIRRNILDLIFDRRYAGIPAV